MSDATNNLLILTVGTGTKGEYSNLAAGLRTTITLLAPRKFWLVPSNAADSIATAELIRDEIATMGINSFAPFAPDTPFRIIPEADSLEVCRQTLRDAIRAARAELRSGERLIVNPTSGTKQMSAGATIAALDEDIGEIVFTVGERDSGVVKTGTERLAAFDASAYFRERDFDTARSLFRAGDFFAAERLLARHKAHYSRAHAVAAICFHWQRLDFETAAAYAATADEALRRHLTRNAALAKEAAPAPEILADILAWAHHALRHNDAETAIRLAYKALEYAARLALADALNIAPKGNGFYALEELKKIRLSDGLWEKIRAHANPDVPLGLQTIVRILRENQCAFGENFDNELVRLSIIRNESVHAIRPVNINEAQSLFDRVKNLLAETKVFAPAEHPTPAIPDDLPAAPPVAAPPAN